jgi:hypothetical protein
MSSDFTLKRTVRLLLSIGAIIAGTYFVMNHYTSPGSSEGGVPELTANCIKLKKIIVDENITDVNCSHENNTDRYFFSVSDDYKSKAEKEFPFTKLVINCSTRKPLTVVKRSSSISDEELNTFISERNFCTSQNFFTNNTEYCYVDKNNSPFITINFVVDQN